MSVGFLVLLLLCFAEMGCGWCWICGGWGGVVVVVVQRLKSGSAIIIIFVSIKSSILLF
jgi:hypothetical protein